MSELYPTDTELNALSGTSDPEQEVLYLPIGQAPYYTSFYKMQHRLLNVARRAGDLRVFKDGELTFGVRAGEFMDGASVRSYAGSGGNVLVAGATNSIYLAANGTLVVSQTGLPDAAVTPHLPLAEIAVGATGYEAASITDLRGRCIYRPASPATAAMIKTLTDGSNADALHTHAAGGAVQGRTFYWDMQTGTDAGGSPRMYFTLRDAASGSIPEDVLPHHFVWGVRDMNADGAWVSAETMSGWNFNTFVQMTNIAGFPSQGLSGVYPQPGFEQAATTQNTFDIGFPIEGTHADSLMLQLVVILGDRLFTMDQAFPSNE